MLQSWNNVTRFFDINHGNSWIIYSGGKAIF